MNLIKHYLTVALRHVWRHRSFSAINVIGLTLGITSCMFIYLWVNDEKSIDNFHEKGDRLYNVYMRTATKDAVNGLYTVPVAFNNEKKRVYVIFEDARETIPEIEAMSFYHAGYMKPWGKAETFKLGDKAYKFEGSRATKDFFNMFSFPLVAGDRATALADGYNVAISRKMSDMFFDSPEQAIGKTLRCENSLDLQVTAVFEDLGPNTSMKFDFLASWLLHETGKLNWSSNYVLGTLLLAPDADVKQVTEKLNALVASRMEKFEGTTTTLGLQPYRDMYLVSNFEDGHPSGGRVAYVKIFTGVAIFIIVIACVNFMNLATARSVKRAKEVGVRKVIGSSRAFLVGQFFGESLLLSFFALLISILLIWLLLPLFNNFTGKQISIPFTQVETWQYLIGLALITGIVAGSYPALFLSSMKPVKVLKGVVSFTRNAIWVRKGMAVFQFGLSILLLIATIVMSQQTSFMQNVNLGYDKENLLYLQTEGTLTKFDGYMAFKHAAEKMPGVMVVDKSSEAPHAMAFLVDEDDGVRETNAADNSAIKWEGKQQGRSVGFKPTSVGFDFLKLMNLDVAEGRGFSREFATDSADAFMVNEQAVKEMGLKDPVGKWVSAWNKKGHIIGILKDYNTNSLHERIRPIIIDVKEYESFGVVMVRTEAGKTKEAIASLETVYKQLNPDYPFSFKFVEEDYDRMYRSEKMITKLSNAFAGLAIVISCLGLLGLIMFSAEQRTKEIGIRKALGATVGSIVGLLSKDFVRIVLISFLIATPVSAWLMSQWLAGFAYKIDLSWWIFAGAGMTALLIALFTISFQAVQSARANPVDSLRSE
ncbi:MAG TPA: FtsX-like permease family protein [Cyclobacteriaceae bacterium]|nr:FtsX-like permease family protein [Cyclobacteriaceae bacterium]